MTLKPDDVVRLRGGNPTQVATVERINDKGVAILNGTLDGISAHKVDDLELLSGAPDRIPEYGDRVQRQVHEFHRAFDLFVGSRPSFPEPGLCQLRVNLIREEFEEFVTAIENLDLVETADAIADLLYVVYGAAISFGIDIRPVVDEVHRSNMTKVGGHKSETGKWIKPKTYEPANLRPILEAQGMTEVPDYLKDEN